MTDGLLGSVAGLLPFNIEALISEGLPAHPLLNMATVTIPKPPLLTKDMTPEHRALLVVRAYLGAATAAGFKFKQWSAYKVGSAKPGDITKASTYGLLCELADLFVEHEISPFAWASWRISVLLHGKSRKDVSTPSLFGLMSKTWLAKGVRRGWFRKDTGSQYGGTAIEPPTVAKIRERWDRMLAEVYAVRPTTADEVREVFAAYFPGTRLAEMTTRAAQEVESLRLQYVARAVKGEWLW